MSNIVEQSKTKKVENLWSTLKKKRVGSTVVGELEGLVGAHDKKNYGGGRGNVTNSKGSGTFKSMYWTRAKKKEEEEEPCYADSGKGKTY